MRRQRADEIAELRNYGIAEFGHNVILPQTGFHRNSGCVAAALCGGGAVAAVLCSGGAVRRRRRKATPLIRNGGRNVRRRRTAPPPHIRQFPHVEREVLTNIHPWSARL